MKTVKEVEKLTGVTVRTLHHYDALGLLKPARVTAAGYRLYDERALERLYLILVYRELGLSLEVIREILNAPDFDRNRILQQQIALLEEKVRKLQNRIHLAKVIQTIGVNFLVFEGFNTKKMDEYSAQAKALYGKTDAYKEYQHKSQGRSKDQELDLGAQLMALFTKLGQMRPVDPASEAAQSWAKELQDFISAHYYTCTPQILQCLGESYAGGGSMTENIDKAGGAGTGSLAKEIIDHFFANQL